MVKDQASQFLRIYCISHRCFSVHITCDTYLCFYTTIIANKLFQYNRMHINSDNIWGFVCVQKKATRSRSINLPVDIMISYWRSPYNTFIVLISLNTSSNSAKAYIGYPASIQFNLSGVTLRVNEIPFRWLNLISRNPLPFRYEGHLPSLCG